MHVHGGLSLCAYLLDQVSWSTLRARLVGRLQPSVVFARLPTAAVTTGAIVGLWLIQNRDFHLTL